MRLSDRVKKARDDIEKSHGFLPNVVSVGVGFKYKDGVRTKDVCVVVGVKKKQGVGTLSSEEVIPKLQRGVNTDVIEYGEIDAYGLTRRTRPCIPGYSVGHKDITAGTLGAWLRAGPTGQRFLLSNSHVLADSGNAPLGDAILQPGPADGGRPADRVGTLSSYVDIHFGNDPPPPPTPPDSPDPSNPPTPGPDPGKGKVSSRAWQAWRWPANKFAEIAGCPFRLVLVNLDKRQRMRETLSEIATEALEDGGTSQPWPNLVDAALALPDDNDLVEESIFQIGLLQGMRDLELGDTVKKSGRTTALTTGMVEVVGSSAFVSYGPRGTATFSDQYVIRGDDEDFSAGGDSGSVVVNDDGMLGALLFAGGNGITLANRISNVSALLGVRV